MISKNNIFLQDKHIVINILCTDHYPNKSNNDGEYCCHDLSNFLHILSLFQGKITNNPAALGNRVNQRLNKL